MSAKSALVQAVYANGKMTVNIRRLGAGEQPAKTSVDVPLLQTVGTTYPAAAQAAVRAIEDLWKTRSRHRFQPARPADRRCAHRQPGAMGRDPDRAGAASAMSPA